MNVSKALINLEPPKAVGFLFPPPFQGEGIILTLPSSTAAMDRATVQLTSTGLPAHDKLHRRHWQ
jgi:hypothetical protein